MGFINDHTYSKPGVSKIFQQYKFIKTASKPDIGKLQIFSLNVGGLKSKLISDELEKEMLNFDIVCLSEVKMDLCDVGALQTDFDQFTIFSNIKEEYKSRDVFKLSRLASEPRLTFSKMFMSTIFNIFISEM